MIFRQSAVTRITRGRATEESPTIPRDVQPALLGSGRMALSLDPLGMQGYDVLIHQYRDSMTLEGYGVLDTYHLHLYHDSVLSEHYYRGIPRFDNMTPAWFSHLPCGYLEYDLTIDGDTYDTARMLNEGCDWTRSFAPRDGIVTTSFILGPVRITWTAGLALMGAGADFQFDAEASDGQEHTVRLRWRHVLRTRYNKAIANGGITLTEQDDLVVKTWQATTETATAAIFKPATVSWLLACEGQAQTIATEDTLELTWEATGASVGTGLRMISGTDRTNSADAGTLIDSARQFRSQGADRALTSVRQSWEAFFADAADMQVGDAGKEYLFAMSQYVLRAGVPWRTGVPLGNLWSRKFGAMTFWDSFYAADGMLRSGHVDEVRQFGQWLMDTRQPTGRPHGWMTWYDGTRGSLAETDVAYINCLAYAGIVIRLAEFTGLRSDVAEIAYPYLHQIGSFLIEEVFDKDDEGWHLSGVVAGDVGIEMLDAREQTDTLLWAVLTVAKLADYADTLGEDSPMLQTAREIRRWFAAHPVKPDIATIWYPWLPYLAPAGPYADYSQWYDGSVECYEKMLVAPMSHNEFNRLYAKGRGKPAGEYPFGVYQGMPWSQCATAASCLIADVPDIGLEFYDGAFKYVSGLGYLTESPYELNVGGHCPYIPSHGAFLSASQMFLVEGSLWDRTVDICTKLPLLMRGHRLRWSNIYSINGVRTSGYYSGTALQVSATCNRPATLRIRIPARIAGEPIAVTVDGNRVDPQIDGETVILPIGVGKVAIEITRDLSTPHEVLVIEPLDVGGDVRNVLAGTGRSVRWVRDFDAVPELAGQSKVIHLHMSYVDVSDSVTAAVMDAVRAGATVLAQFHAGAASVHREFAEFLGVNATIENDWIFASDLRTIRLTQAGKQLLPSLPETLHLETSQKLTPHLAEDVEVLAIDETIGQPALTRRRVGNGWAIWMSVGDKTANMSPEVLQALGLVREVFTKGKPRATFTDLKWLRNADWQVLMRALATRA